MTGYEVVPAEMKHVLELSRTLREDDKREIIAQTGVHHAVALGASYGSAVRAWAGLYDGAVACVFGVSDGDGYGVPWMIGSPLIEKHQRGFLRRCRGYVDQMNETFSILENHVDVRNETAISWLKWLGFDILETEPHGPYKMPFHKFRRVRI